MPITLRCRKIKDLSGDGREELDEIKKTCAAHEELCRQFAECSLQLQQNDAQLEILNETAEFLKTRHAQLQKHIDEKPGESTELHRLQAEIEKVDAQVCMWMKELEEVNDGRTSIEVRFVELGALLRKSATSVQLANIDFDLLQLKHRDHWRRFLQEHESCKCHAS